MKDLLIGTHDGEFHSDEVFAIATMQLVHPCVTWVRSHETAILNKTDMLIDVGGRYEHKELLYDHHQAAGAGSRDCGTPYSSFGLIWKHYGLDACKGDIKKRDFVDRELVSPIDAFDIWTRYHPQISSRCTDFAVPSDFIRMMNTWEKFHVALKYAKFCIVESMKRFEDIKILVK